MSATDLFLSTNNFGGKQTAAVKIALAGHVPEGMHELHVQEDAWTDYVVFAYFRCDPNSLRRILEQPPFIRAYNRASTFSFAETPFTDLQNRTNLNGVIIFERTDLEQLQGSCIVVTDSSFSFAYIAYGVD